METPMTFSRTAFLRIWLFAAILVTAIRLFCATRMGYDQSIQIQAAQNLLAGRGLSIYELNGEADLSFPDRLATLTYFPAGYSLMIAAFLTIGVAPVIAIKIL